MNFTVFWNIQKLWVCQSSGKLFGIGARYTPTPGHHLPQLAAILMLQKWHTPVEEMKIPLLPSTMQEVGIVHEALLISLSIHTVWCRLIENHMIKTQNVDELIHFAGWKSSMSRWKSPSFQWWLFTLLWPHQEKPTLIIVIMWIIMNNQISPSIITK